MQLEETNYDVVIVGTGMVEALLGGALSQVGKTVLQLDPNDFYGSHYRTLSLNELDAMFTNQETSENSATSLNSDEGTVVYNDGYAPFEDEDTQQYEEFLKLRDARRCTVDLVTKVIYSNVDIIPMLVQSSVGRYLEFKCIDSVLLHTSSGWQAVPASKGEIFKSSLNLKEKLYLQKFIKLITESGEDQINQLLTSQQPFIDFLQEQKLSEALQNFVVYAIAMFDCKDKSITTAEGMKRLKQYISSAGRYGRTPFLYPMYGVSELNQSFCRVGAVYTGTYVLRRGIQAVTTETVDDKLVAKSVKDAEVAQTLSCGNLIINNDYRFSDDRGDLDQTDMIARCVTVTDFPVIDETGAVLGVIPADTFTDKQTTAITLLQLDWRSGTSPKGTYIITFQMRSRAGQHEFAKTVLKAAVDQLVNQAHQRALAKQEKEREVVAEKTTNASTTSETDSEQPKEDDPKPVEEPAKIKGVLYQLYYKQHIRKTEQNRLSTLDNTFVCSDPNSTISMEETLNEAKEIFYKICGTDAEFLQKLPNPEEEMFNHVADEDSKLLGIDDQLRQISEESQKQMEQTATGIQEEH